MSTEKKERFHFLDGIRGIASLLIVIHHSLSAGIAGYFNARHMERIAYSISYFTQSGVVLFFVLSGVVLLRPYFVALVFGYLVVYTIKMGPHTFYHRIWQWADITALEFFKQLFIINFGRPWYYNLAWWSLGIEMSFYVMVPVFVMMFKKQDQLNLIKVSVVLGITLVTSYLLQIFLNQHHPHIYSNPRMALNEFRVIDYPVAFLLGIYLAKYDFQEKIGAVFMIVGIGIIIFAGEYLPLVNAGYAFLYAGIIITAFMNKKLQKFLDTPIMIWLGERSYSLFLVHFSVFYITDYAASFFFPEKSVFYAVFTRGVGIPLAFLCAMLLFYYVERRQAKGLVTAEAFWPWQLKKLDKSRFNS